MMSDFALNKKEESKGKCKRTTLYDKHVFNKEKPAAFIEKSEYR
jgi:hypothetical protein